MQNIKLQETESLRDFIKWFRQVVSKWNLAIGMPSCKSSNEVSTQARHSLSLSQRSGLQRWMTCLDGQTNILCSKTASEQCLNRSWSLIVRPRTTRSGVLSPRTNWGKLVRGGLASSSKWDSPPTVKIINLVTNVVLVY